MARRPALPLWQTYSLMGQDFQLLNVDHPWVAAQAMRDLAAGIPVYYDQRWDVTTRLCQFLLTTPSCLAGRSVLVLGAGMGLETIVIGRLCSTLYINDVAPGALTLCMRQLRRNGVKQVTPLLGRYETLPLPPVDVIVGCYLVYNRDTAAAMRQLLARSRVPVLLINDNLLSWQQLLRTTPRAYRPLLPRGEMPCLWFEALDASC